MHSWIANKSSKYTTIQIDKSSNGELRHVELLATKVIKPMLDKLLVGETVKHLTKSLFNDMENQPELSATNKYVCPICQRHFKIERAMKTHMTRTHKELKTEKSIQRSP